MTPTYPHPPTPSDTPTLPVQMRRLLGRSLAAFSGSGVRARPTLDRVLLMRPDHLGDLLFLGPALRWLRQALPEAHLTLAIGPWGRPALPALAGTYDELLEIPFPAFEREARLGLAGRWRMLPSLAGELQAQDFDAAVIFRPDHWWGAMLAGLAHIPWRVGFAMPETTPWLSEALDLPYEHAAASNLRLAGALLDQHPAPDPAAYPLRFELDPASRDEAQTLFSSLPLARNRPLVIIHPGAGAAIKLWEPGKWGSVARRLNQENCLVLVTGGPDEAELTAAVAASSGGLAIDLGGRTSFAGLAALLASADLVLGPDSGPLNLAVAVGTPTIHLFGPADPVRFGPWGDANRHLVLQSDWTCVPCHRFDWPDLPAHGCVRDIAVDAVMAAARQLLPSAT